MPIDIRLVVFDLTGTIIADDGQVETAIKKALGSHGIEASDTHIRRLRGGPKREAIRLLVTTSQNTRDDSSETTNAVYRDFRNYLVEEFRDREVREVQGARYTVNWLRKQGIKSALNTGFDRPFVGMILERIGWNKSMFDAIVCGEEVYRGRPAPFMIFHTMEKTGVISVHQVAVVGDTANDLLAGWNAGVKWNIGVLSGAQTANQLSKEKHTHILESIEALPGLFGKDINTNM